MSIQLDHKLNILEKKFDSIQPKKPTSTLYLDMNVKRVATSIFTKTGFKDGLARRHANIGWKNIKDGNVTKGVTHCLIAIIDAIPIAGAVFGAFEVLMFSTTSVDAAEKYIKAAIEEDPLNLEFATENLQNDKKFVLKTVKKNGLPLQFASEKLRNNKEVVLAALEENGLALQFASEKLRNNKEVVLAALEEDGSTLQYVGKELKNDKDVILAAVNETADTETEDNGFLELLIACPYLNNHKEILNNKEIMLAAVANTPAGNIPTLLVECPHLQNHEDALLAAIKKNDRAFSYVADKKRGDANFVLKAVEEDHRILNSNLKASTTQTYTHKSIGLKHAQPNIRGSISAYDSFNKNPHFMVAAAQHNSKVKDLPSYKNLSENSTFKELIQILEDPNQ